MESSEAQQIIKLLTEIRDEQREENAYNRKANEEYAARQKAAIATQDEAVAMQKRAAKLQRFALSVCAVVLLLGFSLIWFGLRKATG